MAASGVRAAAASVGVGVSQSGLIVATLIAAWVVYLIMAGKLGAYWSILTAGHGGTATSTSTGATIVPGTQTPGTPGLAINPFAGLLPNPFGGTFWHDFIFGPSAPAAPATPAPSSGAK
jgi:hypothetical protein